MSDHYREFAPPRDLESVIDAYWVNLQQRSGAAESSVLPDGCIDLVVRAEKDARRLFTSALTTEPLEIAAAPGGWFVGVRFRPAMSRVVLDVHPTECRAGSIDAAAIDARLGALARRVGAAGKPSEALALLRAEVELRARESSHHAAPPRIRRALELLRSGEAPSASALAEQIGMTERSLHRQMVAWAGLAPKVLARIFRMQRATRMIQAGGCSLAAIALDTGYADQPHMTRELRRLTGRAPGEHVRT